MTFAMQNTLLGQTAGYASQELLHFLRKYSGAVVAETQADLTFRPFALRTVTKSHNYRLSS